jgi:tRNA A37 threonylcarbamoyladenosine dehydratase
MFERLIRVIGKEKFDVLQQKRILIIGVGGVGGYALEALVRSGIEHITLCDGDVLELTNLNRQIIAMQSNVGESKVEEAAKRALLINPSCVIQKEMKKLKKEEVGILLQNRYDYVIDACDDVEIKIQLIKSCLEIKTPIISCMGTGNRIHPEELTITTLNKTFHDPLAKKIRYLLRKDMKETLDIPVVWSREEPLTSSLLGTVCPVPMSAGSLLASFVIQNLVK